MFNIVEFGAKDDRQFNSRTAIQAAIDACVCLCEIEEGILSNLRRRPVGKAKQIPALTLHNCRAMILKDNSIWWNLGDPEAVAR